MYEHKLGINANFVCSWKSRMPYLHETPNVCSTQTTYAYISGLTTPVASEAATEMWKKEQNRKKCDQLLDVFVFALLMCVVCLDHWVVNRRDCADIICQLIFCNVTQSVQWSISTGNSNKTACGLWLSRKNESVNCLKRQSELVRMPSSQEYIIHITHRDLNCSHGLDFGYHHLDLEMTLTREVNESITCRSKNVKHMTLTLTQWLW